MIAVGLDVGGSLAKGVVLDRTEIAARFVRPIPSGSLLELIAGLAADALAERSGPASVGVGLAGLVEWPRGYFVWGPHVAEADLEVADYLRAKLGVPVVVDNDANAAAYAELCDGAAASANTAVVLTLGTGIGGGLIMEGRVVRGSSFAGEVGHITMAPDGDECACGRKGCWETLVSGAVLDRRALELATEISNAIGSAVSDPPSGSDLVRAARSGSPLSMEALREVGSHLGHGIVQLSLILDPEIVVIAGGPSEAGDLLTGPATEAIASTKALVGRRGRPRVVTAHHKSWAGAVGAAWLARELNGKDR